MGLELYIVACLLCLLGFTWFYLVLLGLTQLFTPVGNKHVIDVVAHPDNWFLHSATHHAMALPSLPYNATYIGLTLANFQGTLSWTPHGKLYISRTDRPRLNILFKIDREIDDMIVSPPFNVHDATSC